MRQFLNFQQNKVHYKNYLLLLIICLLAYWPLTFGVFSVKNDAIHYFLPYRFNISEAIRNGDWPFWSPYIYLGNPVYGDMQSGAWNPVVWFFSLIGRYDITLFHYENLLYIFLGGVGMYNLTNRLVQHSHTAILIAVSYMLSGFMLGGQLINWLAAAAFLPFVIHYYLKTLASPSMANPVKAGISLFFLLTAGYPSFFILTGYVLLFLFVIELIKRYRNKTPNNISWQRFLFLQLLILIVFSLLSLPAIISFVDLLPYYGRGGGTTYADTLSNSFEWQHLLSLIFPSSIKANDVISQTDITCRNVYTGIFLIMILAAFPPKFNKRNILLSVLGIFALLFSLGDATPLRKFCYDFIPLMNTFRHPSQMRLFFLFAILLLAAPSIKKILFEDKLQQAGIRVKRITWLAIGSSLIILIFAFFSSAILKQWVGFSFSQIRESIKNTIENISFADTVLTNGIIQIVFLALFLLWLKKYFIQKKLLTFLWVVNLFIMAQLVLPISFVSKTSPAEINKLIHASPKGFPVSNLDKSLEENSLDAFEHYDKISLATFYNKKIGISKVSYSPSFLDQQDQFLQNNLLYQYVAEKPVTYMADSVLSARDSSLLGVKTGCTYAITDLPVLVADSCTTDNKALIKKLSANRFEIETEAISSCLLVLTQSYHPHWKVWIDGKRSDIYKTNHGFMSTLAPRGHHIIVFKFIPSNTIPAIWIMVITILLLITVSIISMIRNNKYSNA